MTIIFDYVSHLIPTCIVVYLEEFNLPLNNKLGKRA